MDIKVTSEIGKVKVKFKKVEGIKSSFKIQTPSGTASVRGTEEEVSYFPGIGMHVVVIEGIIDVIDNAGQSLPTYQDENSGVDIFKGLYHRSDDLMQELGIGRELSGDDSQNYLLKNELNNPGNVDNNDSTIIRDPERL